MHEYIDEYEYASIHMVVITWTVTRVEAVEPRSPIHSLFPFFLVESSQSH